MNDEKGKSVSMAELVAYTEELHRIQNDDVLMEMEAMARERSFPIIGRMCGACLYLLASCIGARRVFEFGSGFGYSAMWFSRAVGPDGQVICTEGDAGNVALAQGFLERVGRWSRVQYHCAWAQEVFAVTDGSFDLIYNDANKEGYEEIWTMARTRIRPGGLYIADNTLWSGRVTRDAAGDETTLAIQQHNRLIAEDPDFEFFLNPARDGLIVARRKIS